MRKKADYSQFDEPITPRTEAEKKALLERYSEEYSEDYRKGNIVDPNIYSEEERATFPKIGIRDLFSHDSEIDFAPEENGLYENQFVENINGAKLKVPLKYGERIIAYKVPVQEGGEQNIGYSINIGSVRYLDEVFDRTPYGIIKKNRTGVGATTLEINSERNSIIVVPTKALAYKKAMTGYDQQTRRFKYLYVGSEIGRSDEFPSIEEYISDESVEHKKIIVVADSLWRVREAIGKRVFKTYFLMVDEIDIYQSDGIFRPALEKVIDYYFKFGNKRRCLVSATMRDFSNPRINCEPTINIAYTASESRAITLIHTDNPNAIVKEKIEDWFVTRPGEKIVIAYNKVKFIRQIIQNLNEECRAECAILCSEASIDHAGVYYREFTEDTLPARINFMTNPFFAGLDFEERFHLISVSNVELIYTLLSPDRFQQIAGRCRHEEGLYSETIVYNTKVYEGKLNSDTYQEYLLNFADDLVKCINKIDEITDKYARYKIVDASFKGVKEDIFEKSKRYYYKDIKMSAIRKNVVTNKYLPAYFNIDSLYDTLKLHIDLYTTPEKLHLILSASNEVPPLEIQNREYTDAQRLNDQIIEREYERVKQEGIEAVIENIRAAAGLAGVSLGRSLEEIHRTSHRNVQGYVECVQDLYKYVPIDRLLSDLQEMYANRKTFKRTYRGYCNAAIFWALADNHIFKDRIIREFPEGAVIPTSEIKTKANILFGQILHKGEIASEVSAVRFINEFIKLERTPNTRLNRYEVISHNKLDFEDVAPTIIPATEDIRGLLKYSGEN